MVEREAFIERMKIPLPKVFLPIYLMTDKQGISAMALSKYLDVAYNTAFDLLRLGQGKHVHRPVCDLCID